MADRVKLTDVIRAYDGAQDFSEWVSKFDLACELRNMSDGKRKLLPMFLEGSAFAVYKQLPQATRDDYSLLVKALTGSFSEDCFGAYSTLQSRKLGDAEAVDVYLADIKRLVSLCEGGDVGSVGMVRCAFVAGLPQGTRAQVLALPQVATQSAEVLLPSVKSILSAQRREAEVCAAGSASFPKRAHGSSGVQSRCFKCGRGGHYAAYCTASAVGEGPGCFRCGSRLHFIRNCPEAPPRGGNGRVEAASAPAASTK